MTNVRPDPRLLRREVTDANVLDLPIRTANALHRFGIKTIGELVGQTWNDVLDIRGIGVTGLAWIYEELRKKGLALKPYMHSSLAKDKEGWAIREGSEFVWVREEWRLEDMLWFTIAYEKTFQHPIPSTTETQGDSQ